MNKYMKNLEKKQAPLLLQEPIIKQALMSL